LRGKAIRDRIKVFKEEIGIYNVLIELKEKLWQWSGHVKRVQNAKLKERDPLNNPEAED
jgi:hypothetical protein